MKERLMMLVGYDGAELLDISCVTSTLDAANRLGAAPAYEVKVATPGGRAITCASGLILEGQRSLERVKGPLDTVFVSGGIGHEAAAGDPRIVGHVRRLANEGRRVASVCTGATVLAAAGLLNGKRATTHWQHADELASAYPEITVDPAPIYIRDGNISTSAGVTSALDLTLAFIEEDHGADLARAVARSMVTYLQRPGNQAQMSMFTVAPVPANSLVKRAVDHIFSHLAGDLTAAALADKVGVSERHLIRLFLDHLGKTPGRFVRDVRLEAAAHLLTSTALPVARVARRCGFRTAETLRQAFVSRYDVSPSHYRATQSASAS
ncbi:GlxA family transcriptional regulator [Streptomyces tuirus]|uniref:GlxA family transcriptional regulator n=1 Tax=Streptomyces tuirus TaxID=68278 RepID=A0A941IZZ0_9ACTN|nr:GlxA family transcriptional regulator [Streptomyces tuirus]